MIAVFGAILIELAILVEAAHWLVIINGPDEMYRLKSLGLAGAALFLFIFGVILISQTW
jgi:hypothetical protein